MFRVDYKEYQLIMTPNHLCGVAGCYSYSIMLHQLFQETPKFCQSIIYHMRIEFIDPVYYDIVTKALIGAGANSNYKFDVNKMLIPDYKIEPSSPRPYEYLLAVLILRKKDSGKCYMHLSKECHYLVPIFRFPDVLFPYLTQGRNQQHWQQ